MLMRPVLFADPVGRLSVLDVTIKDMSLRLIVAYAPNYHSDRPCYFFLFIFWWFEPLLKTFFQVVLTGDLNVIIDPDMESIEKRSGNNNLDMKLFRDFTDKLDLFAKYRNEYTREVVWTWINRRSSDWLVRFSYVHSVLVKRIDIRQLRCTSSLGL